MTDGLLTVSETARLLRVSNESVYRLCRKGKLGAARIGGLWRIPRAAVYQILQGAPTNVRIDLVEETDSVRVDPASTGDDV